MHHKTKETQLQYQGYANTPLLWNDREVYNLKQLEFTPETTERFTEVLPDTLRLGKRVERFVSHELSHDASIDILAENIQIQQDKLTLGELDVLLLHNNQPVHLEIVYKFYLYDARVGTSELEHWIGPNRSDTLVKKLDKLKDKQLPLLFNSHTMPVLERLNLTPNDILQRVWFKAQLFTPYQDYDIAFNLLNKACLKGFYIRPHQLKLFVDCKFNIPNKINWLQETEIHVNWLNYNAFYEAVSVIINNKTSPLCWVKFPNGNIQKFFVVWWD